MLGASQEFSSPTKGMDRLLVLLVVWLAAVCSLSALAESFIDPMKHDIFLVTPGTYHNLIEQQRNLDGVAVLLHFRSKKPNDKKYIDETFNKAAKEVKGMIRFAALDCDQWSTWCKENQNPDLKTPHVVVYPPNPLPPVILEKVEKKSIIQSALKYIPGKNVQMLSADGLDNFLSQHIAVPKVLLFTSKEKTPVLFKALSNAFADRVDFGVVPPSEKSLYRRYKVKAAPACLIVQATSKTPDLYTGSFKYNALYEWINVRAETFVKGGGFTSDVNTSQSTPKPWLVQKVPELTGPSHQDVCFRGSSLCGVFLSRGKPKEEEAAMLEELSEEYTESADRGARFRWMWMDIVAEPNYQELFGIEVKTHPLPSFAVINPHKRLRFLLHPTNKPADKISIQEVVEKIIAGNARFTVIKGQKVPLFAPRSEEKENSKQREEL